MCVYVGGWQWVKGIVVDEDSGKLKVITRILVARSWRVELEHRMRGITQNKCFYLKILIWAKFNGELTWFLFFISKFALVYF